MPNEPQKKPTSRRTSPVGPHSDPWQSRLNPHTEAIWEWRRAHKTLEEIRGLLATEKGVRVALSTLFSFIEARKRRAVKLALPDLQAKTPQASAQDRGAGPAKTREPASTAAPAARPTPRTTDPQTDNNGFPLSDRAEVVGRDSAGRPLTRNRPFKGPV